jgi:hypothetical protein
MTRQMQKIQNEPLMKSPASGGIKSASSPSGLGSGFVGAASIRVRVAVTKSFWINGA